jgi:DNA primase
MWVDFKALTRQLRLSDVARRVGWRPVYYDRHTGAMRGPCPVHKGSAPKSRTFQVRDDLGVFYCFKCKAQGDAVELYALHFGISKREAALRLVKDYGLTADQVSGEERR